MHKRLNFYGSTTLGEKGQVVIPVEAREKLELTKGQKLLAFGSSENMLVLAKPEIIEQFADILGDLNRTLEQESNDTTSK
jgi:AbrB family looped-hinge helix DNA binding protein